MGGALGSFANPVTNPLMPWNVAGTVGAIGQGINDIGAKIPGSTLGGLLGMNGGVNGTGFSAPTAGAAPAGANITPGVTPDQLATGYGGAQNSLQSQQALLAALQQQNGINNQSQVYNQMQGVANGTGPNPAQAMLNNATGQNVANQASLMAGQRGAGANVGLMARQAAQQGAGIQQQAAGQGAALQAQQQLGALGAMGNIAGQQVNNQIGATGANTQAGLTQEQLLQNANAAQNTAGVGMQGNVNNNATSMQENINNANAGLAGQTIGGQIGVIGGVANGIGKGLGMMGGMAGGGVVQGPQSVMGRHLMMAQGGNIGSQLKAGGHVPGNAKTAGNSYSNDTVKALLSPGELVVDRETMKDKGKAGDAARFLAAVIAKKKGKK